MTRQLRALILISLLLNILLGGMLAGQWIKRAEPLPDRYAVLDGKLSAAHEAGVRQALAALDAETKQGWEGVRAKKEAVLTILSAPRFDQAAYDKATAVMETQMHAQFERRGDVVRALATSLPQSDRVALAEFLRQPPKPWWQADKQRATKAEAGKPAAGMMPPPAPAEHH